MCEFCIKHGEGKKWYLLMKNYSEELLHAELSGNQSEEVRVKTREEWMRKFVENFCIPAVTGVPKAMELVARSLLSTSELRGPQVTMEQAVEGKKVTHFGQVLPIEDAEAVIDLASSITRLACGCRFLSIGKADKRYCFGLGVDVLGMLGKFPDASSSLEVLDREEAKKILRKYDEDGLIHTVWTGVTPFIIGLCNCDRDCLAYKAYIEQRGSPTFFRAEYVCRVDPELCNGCKECMKQCQFGAQFYSSAEGRVHIDSVRCYGCGVCRPVCPTNAIELLPRKDEPKAADLWLQ
jgi:Pyruvate/2-oxoacid:ferredoxin oxidoreductase delta subunit